MDKHMVGGTVFHKHKLLINMLMLDREVNVLAHVFYSGGSVVVD